jgi:hypothetical protein
MMQVEFQKTGERRYAVIIKREDLPDMKMNPAPGFDPLMPHDLLHFLVEEELGLRRGFSDRSRSAELPDLFKISRRKIRIAAPIRVFAGKPRNAEKNC